MAIRLWRAVNRAGRAVYSLDIRAYVDAHARWHALPDQRKLSRHIHLARRRLASLVIQRRRHTPRLLRAATWRRQPTRNFVQEAVPTPVHVQQEDQVILLELAIACRIQLSTLPLAQDAASHVQGRDATRAVAQLQVRRKHEVVGIECRAIAVCVAKKYPTPNLAGATTTR